MTNQRPATPGTAARCEICGRENCLRPRDGDDSGYLGPCHRLGFERLKAENASLLESLRAAERERDGWHRKADADVCTVSELAAKPAAAEQRAEAAEKRVTRLTAALEKMVLMTEADLEGGPNEPTDEWVAAYRAARAALHDEERSAPQQVEETALAALRKELERNIAELNEATEACCSAEVERDDAIAEMTRLQEAVERGHTDACATYIETLRAGLEREIARRDERIASLFDAIAHGDDKHRAWLREAIEQHFSTATAAQGEEK